ncbi:ThuA domain-containing protein [Novosphingobium sp.]|uniref:ThuA domain-containing protein n=1 Tax=Novosphingobium sp. TaxID=1874826 RepID=UPI00333F27D5
MLRRIVAASLLLGASTAALAAEPVRDCPLAATPLGIESPLSDVLMHPGGRPALESVAPDLVSGFTRAFGGGGLPPGFANILTPGVLLDSRPDGAMLRPVLSAKLAALPITDAFTLARCARYDHERPVLPARDGRRQMLVFEKINGFRDNPSVDGARARLTAIAKKRGWQIVFTDRGGVMNAADLARFDVVVWNNVSGDALTTPQRAAFRAYVEQGGGFAGIHGSGGDPRWFWDWYVDTLIGARFIGHPGKPQFQTATVRLVDGRSGIGAGVAEHWPLLEEWYSFDRNPVDGGAVAVATIDEQDYKQIGYRDENLAMGYHPIAWRKFVGDGRMFYTAIGHRPENYDEPQAAALLANGIAWAMRNRATGPKGKHDHD